MTPSAISSRLNVIPFWLANISRSAAENSIRVYVLILLGNGVFRENHLALIFAWILLAAVPAVLLSPLVGAVASSAYRKGITIFGALAAMAIVAYCHFSNGPWLSCLGIIGIEGLFFATTRQAMLPVMSKRCHWSLPQLMAAFGVGILGGALAGIGFSFDFDPFLKTPSGSLPLPLQIGFVGYAVTILLLLFTRFDVPPEWSPSEGIVRPYLRTVGTVLRDYYTRCSLILMAIWFALFLLLLRQNSWLLTPRSVENFGLALVVGIVIGGMLHFHPFRAISMVHPAMTALFFFIWYSVATDNWEGPSWFFGILLGCMLLPILTHYQSQVCPGGTQGHAVAYMFAVVGIVAAFLAVLLLNLRFNAESLDRFVGNSLFGLSLAGTLFAWFWMFLPFLGTVAESLLVPMHRIRSVGPGNFDIPFKGPTLIIANHAAMLDPFWLATVCPQNMRPMMISIFYDLPVISWMMRKIVRAIRVSDSSFRREAPEIQEAIQALKNGESVMIFPEAWLRRSEEVEMRRFSRGVWQILKACPNTPVYAYWIEGGWGSYFSFKDGPLMTNKKLDLRRLIRVAGIEGRVVDPKTLEKHLQTRRLLMEWVLEARSLLNLPPIDLSQVPTSDKEEMSPAEGGA